MKSGVLILECLGEADPGSEGQFLLHMFAFGNGVRVVSALALLASSLI